MAKETANELTSGVCRYCGCTDEKRCFVAELGNGFIATCDWLNDSHTICSADRCYASALTEGLIPSLRGGKRVGAEARREI